MSSQSACQLQTTCDTATTVARTADKTHLKFVERLVNPFDAVQGREASMLPSAWWQSSRDRGVIGGRRSAGNAEMRKIDPHYI